MVHWCLGCGLSRGSSGESRSHHNNATFHSQCTRGLHRTKWHPQVSQPTFYSVLFTNFYSPLFMWKEQVSMGGGERKSNFFFLIQSGRWRREHCWLTPQPSIQLSQKKWQSLQRKWEPCSWMHQWQEVETVIDLEQVNVWLTGRPDFLLITFLSVLW